MWIDFIVQGWHLGDCLGWRTGLGLDIDVGYIGIFNTHSYLVFVLQDIWVDNRAWREHNYIHNVWYQVSTWQTY